MMCENCGLKKATIVLYTSEQGEKRLCTDCQHVVTETVGELFPSLEELISPMGLASLFGPGFGTNLSALKPTAPNQNLKTCTTCGFTLKDILQNGRLGCGNDYKLFEKELEPLISKVQAGALKHVGRSPIKKRTLEDIQQELNNAIAAEKYEDAARLRDELKRLQGS